MSFFETKDPDVIEIKKGGGCLALFGLPFLLAGLLVMQAPFGLIPMDWEGGPPPWYFALPFGAVFAMVGGALVFGRSGIRIDKRLNTARRWWSFLGVIVKSMETPLGMFEAVSLSRENRGDSDSSKIVFPVKMVGGASEVDPIELAAPTSYEEGRKAAEELSKFLSLPLEDSSAGKTVVRDAEKLDESYRDRSRRTAEPALYASMPMNMRSVIRGEYGALVVEIPPPPLSGVHYLQMLFPLIFAGLIYYFFLRDFLGADTPQVIKYVFGGFILLFFIALPVLTGAKKVLAQLKKRTIVTASPQMLRVEERGISKARVVEIPGPELEEFELKEGLADLEDDPRLQRARMKSGKGGSYQAAMPDPNSTLGRLLRSMGGSATILARSDTETVSFGEGLPLEELKYIYSELKRAIIQ